VHKDYLTAVADDVPQPAAMPTRKARANLLAGITDRKGKKLKTAKVVYKVGAVVGTEIDGKIRSCKVFKVPETSQKDLVVAIKKANPTLNKTIAKLIASFLPKPSKTYTLTDISNNSMIERPGHELKAATKISPMILAMLSNPRFTRIDSPDSHTPTAGSLDSSCKEEDSEDGKTEVTFTKDDVVVTFGVTKPNCNSYKATVDGMTGNFNHIIKGADKKALRNEIVQAIVSEMGGNIKTAHLNPTPWDLTKLKEKDVVTLK